ncbi:DUF2750 domain-containing protein [Pseudoalteromonas sp. J010]|nr:DUF2750 domain-containing protein [Pseudoalteromonas sp. J010]RXF03531.1 DUF2750 domain-containing protein [Pseudoalteromonas sp. PS5]
MMNEEEIGSEVSDFIGQVKNTESVWALSSSDGGMVVVDSNQFDETDVLLLWDSEEKAQAQCRDEWSEFSPMSIDIESFLDEWVLDLKEDDALVGLNWNDDNVCIEIEPVGLARLLVDIE